MPARVTRSSTSGANTKTAASSLPTPPATNPRKRRQPAASKTEDKNDAAVKDEDAAEESTQKKKKKKKKRTAVKQEPSPDSEHESKPPTSKASKATPKSKPKPKPEPSTQDPTASPTKPSSRSKSNPYGLSPGQSPYPSYPHPTPSECHEVNRILQHAHGKVSAPATIPTPSLDSSGCGEVPSVLDALIRTRLSAATNNANSSRAFRGLVQTFGVIGEGVGKGSVDWDRVRRVPVGEVFEAIKSGGLAGVKSRDIQKILEMVHEENQERKQTLKREGGAEGANESTEQKTAEISRAEHSVLSLDHLHLLSNDAAFNKLLTYPGIGPKTASCVLLFCMQRPSFAVDTHVFRLTRWLGWTPSEQAARGMAKRGETKSGNVTRESTYAHLEVRVPDELKYPLHYLLIRHGKNCGWCSAKAGREAKVGVCPVAHLMRGKGSNKGMAKGVKSEDGAEDEEDEEEESPELKSENESD